MLEDNGDTNITPKETKSIIFQSIKTFFIYAIICAIPPVILRWDAMLREEFISEISLTENLQLLMLVCTVALFVHIAYKTKSLRRACILIAGFFLALFIRENDARLDSVYHGFWFPIALVVSLAAISYFMFDYKNAFTQFALLLKAPPMQLMIFSLALLLVFSRLFGMGSFWRMIMQEHFIYGVKSMIEEGTELLAYISICYASFKLNRFVFSHDKQKETHKIA